MTTSSTKVDTRIHREDGKAWLVVSHTTFGGEFIEVRERWPAHMEKLDSEKRMFFMRQAADRLHAKLKKRIGYHVVRE